MLTRPVLQRLFLVACCLCVMTPSVLACLWDQDTLRMERSRFPETLELITGRFLRHSKSFYEWRIQNRSIRINGGESTKDLYDDLAVAYDKTGQHAKAIETIEKKESLWPGQYETLANRGTFLIHSGKLETGLKDIRKAIEVNPDAHFGREVYQQLLVEYVLSRRDGNKTVLPLGSPRKNSDGNRVDDMTFAKFIFSKRKVAYADQAAERKKALKGIRGMMRFGNFDSPVLLEALGDLLVDPGRPAEDAKLLAARAYLKASNETKKDNPDASRAYFALAKSAVKFHEHTSVDVIRRQLTDELKTADKWWKTVAADEKKWIRMGVNADAEFTKKYFKEPVAVR